MKIGVISDTHGYVHSKLFKFFENCDEIWHAGDIGNIETADKISGFKHLRAVYGNIDGQDIRLTYPLYQSFEIESLKVLMIHIGGYPGKYNPTALRLINEIKLGLFISVHSHILKVMPDKGHNLLHINPGSAGKYGLHQKITMVRFDISNGNIHDLEIMELPK
jgi:uncharacterized protein